MLKDMVSQFSDDLEALRLTLEQIPISQRQLHLSQWIRYILLSNNIRLNIKLVALIQKNVDKLSAPNHLEKEIEQWFNALKPQGKLLRDIYGREIDAIDLEDLMSDTESDSDSDSFSESMLEFIPGTMDQLIQDLLESIPRC
ncbi:hypothetical protein TNCV_471691 [Trichonephila clavipes]|uniref:Uncharacterized protein n=1 Tax=Trichonephila clavipes TaxID=2585209 RepID=A0A8X6RCD2_TRICX|nr:hypothetical protein TNCV_471691 [Trichonephila clavipes]